MIDRYERDAEALYSGSASRESRRLGEYALSIDLSGDKVFDRVTCYDDFHPDGINVEGWLTGIHEAIGRHPNLQQNIHEAIAIDEEIANLHFKRVLGALRSIGAQRGRA